MLLVATATFGEAALGVAYGMRVMIWLLMVLGANWSNANALPTCEVLLGSIPRAFAAAHEVVVAVRVVQGSRELAFESSRLQRNAAGDFDSMTLERRGFRRPAGAGGEGAGGVPGSSFDLPCDQAELTELVPGELQLYLVDVGPDAFVAEWTLRFRLAPEGWLPVSVSAPFEVRVLLLPVRGRFVTEFSGWLFVRP